MSAEGSTRAIFYALGANAGIAVAKFTAAAFTGSGAMIAEAIHSLADCTNQVFLLIGMRESRKPPTAEHPMGYGRVVYFWAMRVALLLFSLAAGEMDVLRTRRRGRARLIAILTILISREAARSLAFRREPGSLLHGQ
jgi:hypothetical protein